MRKKLGTVLIGLALLAATGAESDCGKKELYCWDSRNTKNKKDDFTVSKKFCKEPRPARYYWGYAK